VPRRRLKGRDLSGAGLGLSAVLIAVGLALTLIGFRAASVLAALGFLLLVVLAWICARPHSAGVQPEIYAPWPWGPHRDLVEFSHQLERDRIEPNGNDR